MLSSKLLSSRRAPFDIVGTMLRCAASRPPGRLRRISAFGCCSEDAASSASTVAVWRTSSVVTATSADTVTPNACATSGVAVSCSVRSAVLISCARVWMLRWRLAARDHRLDLGDPQRRATLRGRRLRQHRQCVPRRQVVERRKRGGVELPQGGAQRVRLALPRPDHVLVRAGQHLDRLRELAVPRDRAMLVPVSADQVGQHVSITRVGLRPRGDIPVPVRDADSGLIAYTW